MKILFVGAFLPYTFSENLCNGKLVYALQKAGIEVDVISKETEGPSYDTNWKEPWLSLKAYTHEIKYPVGNKLVRIIDTIYSCLRMRTFPIEGIRWTRRAYRESLKLHRLKHYDAILTRSPSDIYHLVGYRFSKKMGVKWLANWNDPARPIWPEPYTHHDSKWKQWINSRFIIKCLKKASANTFPSQYLLEHFITHYPFLKELNTIIIPHIGLHDTIFPAIKFSEQNKTFCMCHSGNLSKERNPDLLFKAIRELSDDGYDIQFDIIGYSNDYLKDLVSKYDINSKIHFIGSYPYMDTIMIMSKYDVLVLVEAIMQKGIFFPSKLTDYSQLGKPILAVSPANGFAHDALNKYNGGIAVDNTDSNSIKNGILRLYNSWKKGELSKVFNSEALYENFSSNKITGIYKTLI